MVRSYVRLLFVGLLLFAPRAMADAGYDAALAAFDKGDYQEAAAMAGTLDSADGDALEARALLAAGGFTGKNPEEAAAYLEKAIAAAQAALKRAPGHLEAHLQAAIALGYKARLERDSKLARAARKHIDFVIDRDPGRAYAWASLGAWHGEVLIEAGGFFGGLALGAKRRAFEAGFEKALKLAPDNPAIPAYYARLLLALGGKTYRSRAAAALKEALARPARNAFEIMIKDQAQNLAAALAAKDAARLKDLIKSQTPFHK